MRRNHNLMLFVSPVLLVLAVSIASAQSGKEKQKSVLSPQEENPYSEANLKFDVLEAQIQTLRKKMQLQAKRKAERTEEWNQHYETVKRNIEAWDDFVDSYGVK